MKFFLDTANLAEIKRAMKLGVIHGITTNPTLIAKEGREFYPTVREICALCPGPVSAEVISLDAAGMIKEAEALAALAPNVVVKIPMTANGLEAVAVLSHMKIKTNVTLIFTLNQALLAARAGADYVSPFVGRLDDISAVGMDVVRDMAHCFSLYGFTTEIIAASVRHPQHVHEAAVAGAHIATVPYKVIEQMINHPLTTSGIERFLADWRAVMEKGN
ncbi:MAG: fructose-6-phosphate aldolase [Peptococcaceae bacterium]|nr:fructose-6-phosphate aldolase [Peptococcaceae bacterium]